MSGFTEFSDLEKAVATGVYLSKFDKQGLDESTTGFGNAYNVLGYSLGVLPKSIQNYRDEFDLFSKSAQGMAKPQVMYLRKYSIWLILFLTISRLVNFVIKDYDAEQYSEKHPIRILGQIDWRQAVLLKNTSA